MFYNNKNKSRKNFFICFILSIFIMGSFSYVNINKTNLFSKDKVQEAAKFSSKIEIKNKKNPNKKVSKASILAVGDIMIYNSQLNAQYNASTKSYDFKNNFKYVKKYIEKADYSMANLETTLTGNDIYKYSSYPKFNSPDELADALKYAGFDLISTANNHAYDKGDLSIKNTLYTLKKNNLDVIGTRQNYKDKKFIIKKINNINIGITSFTFGEIKNDNLYLNDSQVSNNYKNKINVFNDSNVDSAFESINSTLNKMSDADLKVVYLHWGNKYHLNENDFQQQLSQKLCNAGVDIIIGSHPHVIQPVTTIKSSDNNHETIVAYSLGNFLSNQRREDFSMYDEDGLIINIDISKNHKDNKTTITKVCCIPTWLNKYYNNQTSKYIFEIIPLDKTFDLNKASHLDKNKAKKSYEHTSSQIKTSDLISISKNPFK